MDWFDSFIGGVSGFELGRSSGRTATQEGAGGAALGSELGTAQLRPPNSAAPEVTKTLGTAAIVVIESSQSKNLIGQCREVVDQAAQQADRWHSKINTVATATATHNMKILFASFPAPANMPKGRYVPTKKHYELSYNERQEVVNNDMQ